MTHVYWAAYTDASHTLGGALLNVSGPLDTLERIHEAHEALAALVPQVRRFRPNRGTDFAILSWQLVGTGTAPYEIAADPEDRSNNLEEKKNP